MFNYNEFGKGVRYFRKQNDLTLEKLAAKADTGIPYLIKIEKGQARPSLKMIINICNALQISISDCLSKDKGSDKFLYKQFKAKVLLTSDVNKQLLLEIIEGLNTI
jgi:transcriptional regulator with XRE-family HTH domain